MCQNKMVNPSTKAKFINKYLLKLIKIAEKEFKKNNINKSLSALSAYCSIQYSINQVYTDKRAETLLERITKKMLDKHQDYTFEKHSVLFYDGFGLDLRGWAASYARALTSLKYRVIYVVPEYSKNSIPHIISELSKGDAVIEYIDTKKSYVDWISELDSIINRHKPHAGFFYTTPNDVSGAAVFNSYKGKMKRIQIDLTDHAFWVGINAFDLTIDSRKPGLSNMVYNRGISKDRIMATDCCPYVIKENDNTPFPFDIEKEKYVFSGGALYKTLGDEHLYFYKIVEHILSTHKYIKFLYAGKGDDSEIKKLKDKYPERVFLIGERTDFIRMFENCIFFLNTYPMFGGLMMRYAAMVGKVPLTLKHGSDHEGLLKNQEKRLIEYNTYAEIIEEADKLIVDEQYRKRKERLLQGAVVTEKEFENNLKGIVESGKVVNPFCDISKIDYVDTTDFRNEYLKRLNPKELLIDTIPNYLNRSLISYFPILFIRKLIRRIVK